VKLAKRSHDYLEHLYKNFLPYKYKKKAKLQGSIYKKKKNKGFSIAGKQTNSMFGLVIENHDECKIMVSSPQKQLFVASKNHDEFNPPPIQTHNKEK